MEQHLIPTSSAALPLVMARAEEAAREGASIYHRRFGETPSATLRRGRAIEKTASQRSDRGSSPLSSARVA